jgi:predicted nucleotide-binding protein
VQKTAKLSMSQTLYFHALISFIDDTEKLRVCHCINQSEEELKRDIVDPFNTDSHLILYGYFVPRIRIKRIMIFKGLEIEYGAFRKIVDPSIENKELLFNTIANYILIFSNHVTSNYISLNAKSGCQKLSKSPHAFIVHGRDETSAILLQKHLLEKGINAEMFEDFKRRVKGNSTVIEELIKIKDETNYAFIIATADDLGNLGNEVDYYIDELVRGNSSVKAKDVCDIKSKLNYRPRQNVMFEFGLFLGVLGREKVECLWDKKIGEEPSDIKGVLSIHFDKSIRETFSEIDGKIEKIKGSLNLEIE